jgi:CheY-like chemotaxis protein
VPNKNHSGKTKDNPKILKEKIEIDEDEDLELIQEVGEERTILTDEEIDNLDLNSDYAKHLMESYEAETDKNALWNEKVTKSFIKWLKGEKIYNRKKERISFYISEDKKESWQHFLDHNKKEYRSFSKLIRDSVNAYIQDSKKSSFELAKLDSKLVSNISHALKEPLTSIKGYSQLLLESDEYKEKLSEEVKETIKNILDQSNSLEDIIKNFLDNIQTKSNHLDILLIEDDLPTIRLITRIFESKGFLCKGVVSGSKGLEELGRSKPKVILLDILLPDLSGYDICKSIKSDNAWNKIPVYFLTAFSGSEVKKHLEETKADGYILKPFNFADFEVIFSILSKKK